MPAKVNRPRTIDELKNHLQPGDFAWYVRSKSMRGMDPRLAYVHFYRPVRGKARSTGSLTIFCSIPMSDFGTNGVADTKEALSQLAASKGYVLREEQGDPCEGVRDKLLVFRRN